MDIELSHNPLRLPNRALLKVSNAKQAKLYLDNFIDSKLERGYRLRVIEDNKTNTIQLQSRKDLNVRMALSALREAHFKPRFVAYKDCQLFLDIVNKGSTKPK